MDYKFKGLTLDNAFDFCDVLGVIGVEEIASAFKGEKLQRLLDKKQNDTEIGFTITVKICGILIKNVSKARQEIYRFFANCMELDDGTAVTMDDMKKLKLTQFVAVVKDFAKTEELVDFFEEVLKLLDMEQ